MKVCCVLVACSMEDIKVKGAFHEACTVVAVAVFVEFLLLLEI